MRETQFIEQNKEKWEKFEGILRSKEKDPDKLSDLFIQVTDDLSYSRTFYPNRSVRVYLNNLAQQIFHNIYKTKKGNYHAFISFWTETLPRMVWLSRKEFLLSFAIFALAVLIGIVSSAHDPDFAKQILGEGYVAMTESNIEEGDPMAVYKKGHQMDMFLGISINNLFVSFYTFIFGILSSLGTILILLGNGIMLGSFQFFFFERGLFTESFLTIWMHGTLEISAIIISGASGIVLGKGILFPGTYSRIQAFIISARKGLTLFLGVVPVLIFAALIESFLTRYTELPDLIRLGVIMISLFFILGYFVFYPWLKARKQLIRPITGVKLPAQKKYHFKLQEVKANGEIFRDIFVFTGKHLRSFALTALAASVVFGGLFYLVLLDDVSPLVFLNGWLGNIPEQIFGFVNRVLLLSNVEEQPWLLLINAGFYTTLIFTAAWKFQNYFKDKAEISFISTLLKSVTGGILLTLVLFPKGIIFILLIMVAVPFILIYTFGMIAEQDNPVRQLAHSFLLINQFPKFLGFYLILLGIGFIFGMLTNAPILLINTEAIQLNFERENDTFYLILFGGAILLTVFAMSMIYLLFMVAAIFSYYSMKEAETAEGLKERIKNATLGKR